MQVNKIENNPNFGERVKLNTLKKSAEKLAKDLGTSPEMLAGTASVGTLSSSAVSLATANYSGLAKVLPVNVSLPISTGVTSTVGYKAYVNKAQKAAKQEAINAKRRGESVSENQTDPDFLKAIFNNLKERFNTLFKINKEK